MRCHGHVQHHATGEVARVRADGLAVAQQLLARLFEALQSGLRLRRLALTCEQLAAALVESIGFSSESSRLSHFEYIYTARAVLSRLGASRARRYKGGK